MRIVATDQSISDSGVCERTSRKSFNALNIKTKAKDWTGRDFSRKMHVASCLKRILRSGPCHLFVMEGYALGVRKKSMLADLAELGSLIKLAAHKSGIPVLAVAPTQVKKFATGNGKATKAQVIAGVRKYWGFCTKNDNIADAFVLALIGYYYAKANKKKNPVVYIQSRKALTKQQKEVLIALLKGDNKKCL